jgi:fumarate hydratase class II
MATSNPPSQAANSHSDPLGPVVVPPGAMYGQQTARAVANFPISGWPMPREFIAALGLIKAFAAEANASAGRLPAAMGAAIAAAARELADGRWDDQMPVDVFQTGSGTSTNMNANEVIASRAMQLDASLKVHPNDHVNMGQSSNDVIPSAMHVSAATAMRCRLMPALARLRDELARKAGEFDGVVKIGRTHLMDAVPVRLGQEFAGYAAQVSDAMDMLDVAILRLCRLALGGTAVGTGLNAPAGLAAAVCSRLSHELDLPFEPAGNCFAAMGAKDTAVLASGVLKTTALALGKIASDIRLMGSGPRCGIGELLLPATQAGSSIMPGKVNPVMCESVIQVACQVVGCDAAISAGATGGVGSILELNVAMPMIASNLLTAVRLLANVAEVFATRCVSGLRADAARAGQLVEQSLAMITVLAPRIGYDAAAQIAREAHATGKTIRQLCLEKKLLPQDELSRLLDPRAQTGDSES